MAEAPGGAKDPRGAGRFATTRWSLVLSAGGEPERGRAALAELCALYWYPLYAYARRRGYDRHAAEDLTQGFFARLLEKRELSAADPERGRFRGFLIAAARSYMANEWDKEQALKRGGGRPPVSLDVELAERRLELEGGEATPDGSFDRDWALALLDTVLARLRAELAERGRGEHFDALKPYLVAESGLSYARTAELLETTEGAVKVAVHRLRGRFAEELRREVAGTVSDQGEVEDELCSLIESLGSR